MIIHSSLGISVGLANLTLSSRFEKEHCYIENVINKRFLHFNLSDSFLCSVHMKLNGNIKPVLNVLI